MTGNVEGCDSRADIESTYAWVRLSIALMLGTIGSIGMWSFVVALPALGAINAQSRNFFGGQ